MKSVAGNFSDLCHKCLVHGRQNLSESELIGVLLGSASKNRIEADRSKQLLEACKYQLHRLAMWDVKDYMDRLNLTMEESVRLAVVWELSRRQWQFLNETPTIRNSKDAFRLFYGHLSQLPYESFHVALLNRANRVIYDWELSRGGLNATVVDIRILMKEALNYNAVGLIVAHNHPSGNLKPSVEDERITEKLKSAAVFFDLTLMDHIIVSADRYFSFADEGRL